MDFNQIIKQLQSEKLRIERAIETLESLQSGASVEVSRRGRKGMSSDERKIVSERMRRYWASRRAHTKVASSS